MRSPFAIRTVYEGCGRRVNCSRCVGLDAAIGVVGNIPDLPLGDRAAAAVGCLITAGELAGRVVGLRIVLKQFRG